MCLAKELTFYPKIRNVQRALGAKGGGQISSSGEDGRGTLDAGRRVRKFRGSSRSRVGMKWGGGSRDGEREQI